MRIILYLMLALIISCNEKSQNNTNNGAPFSENIQTDDDFYFEKGIYQVVDNVYVAIGYGLANSILIVGDTGNIIIDTTEDPELGKQINDEFKKSQIYQMKLLFILIHMWIIGEVLQGFMRTIPRFMLMLHFKKDF